MSAFKAALPVILRHEGGYVDHPRDPGGATNLGVTIGTLSDWLGRPATKSEVRALTVSDVAPIYRQNYWNRVRGDDLPMGVNLVTFDASVNSGPARGARWLQRAVGTKADGVVGDITIAATKKADPKVTVKRSTDDRLGFLQGLRTWSTFGRGWGRRVGEIRALGLLWAGEKKAEIIGDADDIDKRAKNDERAATGSATGGAASGGSAPLMIEDPVQIAVLVVVAIALVALGYFLALRGRARHDAAQAMRETLGEN